MAVRWSGGVPELLVTLERADREPLGQQIQRQLRDAVRTGRLAGGERLPSTRALAEQLGVSRGLIVSCYEQLESEGYLVPRAGSGSAVATGAADTGSSAHAPPAARRPIDVDFEYGVPDLASFPRRDWAWALAHACRSASVADIGDEAAGGGAALRTVLASYLQRVRAAVVDAEHVVVVPGFRHGLHVVFRTLAASGVTRVGLEDPGPTDSDVIARASGLEPVPVPVDDEGLDVEALSRSAAGAVLVTPAHQCPTGVVLSARRRQALVEWARTGGGVVIEDDYDAEFRYDRQPVGSVQGLAPDRVIAMGSVSKTLAPTIRIGWMAVPDHLQDALLAEKQLLSRGAPGLDQLALAAFIESGRFDKHLRHMRQVYRRRRNVLVDSVARAAPGVAVTGLSAGCHAVLALDHDLDEHDVVARCAERRVAVYPMSRYRLTAPAGAPPQLVLGFGNVSERAIADGIDTLGDVLTTS